MRVHQEGESAPQFPLFQANQDTPVVFRLPHRHRPYLNIPTHHVPTGLWFYGNVRLLECSPVCLLIQKGLQGIYQDQLRQEAEGLILSGHILVCSTFDRLNRMVATLTLKWGAPRILVVPSGFYEYLGKDLMEEPLQSARSWRSQWDAKVDLIVSERHPREQATADSKRRLPQVARYIATRSWAGFPDQLLLPYFSELQAIRNHPVQSTE